MGSSGSALRVCADHRGGINWLSLSPDGQRLLTGSEDGTARLWSTADGQCCALLQGHESYVTFCQLEDEAAFTCSADCTIRRWDVKTGQCLQVYRGHTSIVNRILVANDQLFSSSYDRTARAWTVDKEQVSKEFRGHRNCVLTLAYSAPKDLPSDSCLEAAMGGGLLVTGSTDDTAKVWQVASGCCHQTLRGHTGAVLCLVLDVSSHTAFTGSTDATVRAWDILSGEQLRVFREHQGSVICLELTDRLLYTGSADRTVKCWLADTGERVRTFPAHRHSCSQAVGMPAPGPSMPSQECCRGCSEATPLSSTASRSMVRCSTQHLMTVLYVSGMYVDSSRYHLRHADQQPSAAYRASLATRWPVQPQCPCSQPEYLERGGKVWAWLSQVVCHCRQKCSRPASSSDVLCCQALSAEEMGLLTRATDKLYARLLLKDSNTCQSALRSLFGFLLEARWPAIYVQYLARIISPLGKKACEPRSFTRTLGEAREQGTALTTSLPDRTLGVPTHFWTEIQEFSVKVWH